MTMKHCLSLFVALLFFAPPCFAAKLPPEARQAMHKAQMRMDDKDYPEAARILTAYMKTAEDIPADAYLMLGGAHHLAGNKEKALAVFEKGAAAKPDHPGLALNSAITNYEMEHYARAGRLFEKAYDLTEPPKPDLLYQAGAAYYAGEKYDASATVMTRLIAMEKKPKKEWVRLAIHTMMGAGKTEQARTMLMRYLTASPGESPYWELLAKLHLDSERYVEAAAALEICYRLGKPSSGDIERLASLYAYVNAPLMATATLKRICPATPSAKQAQKIASLLAAAGRTSEAVRLLDASPDKASLAGDKGRFLYDARRFEEAETALKQGLSAAARQGQARFYLAMCAWERQDWKNAKANLSRVGKDKEYKQRAATWLAVIEDLEAARREADE